MCWLLFCLNFGVVIALTYDVGSFMLFGYGWFGVVVCFCFDCFPLGGICSACCL